MCTVWQCTTWSAIDIQDKSYKYFQEESQSEQVNEPPYVLPQCVSHSIGETLNSRSDSKAFSEICKAQFWHLHVPRNSNWRKKILYDKLNYACILIASALSWRTGTWMTSPLKTFWFLSYKKTKIFMLPWFCSIIDNTRRQNVVRLICETLGCPLFTTYFLPRFDFI